MAMLTNPKAFFAHVRETIAGGVLTESQVIGLNLFITEADKRQLERNIFANICGQVWWETGKTFAPVEEAYYLGGKAEAYRKKLRYYPFHGRGHIQTTWQDNYKKSSDIWNELFPDDKQDFVANPHLLLENKYSVPLTFEGFARGTWTGKKGEDFIDELDESDQEDLREFANARRVVNGLDRAAQIGKISLEFEKGLMAGGWPVTLEEAMAVLPPEFVAEMKALMEKWT